MADFRINVIIDPSGAQQGSRRVNNSLNQIGNNANRVRRLIVQAFAFTGVTVGIRQLVALTDAFTNVQNRIRTVTQGTAELNAVTQQLFTISNRTRSSFEATAEVYARTALATRELGISQAETLRFTESLNQAVILSGASAQEANNALIQLSQGLASGALRGDELRSVLEQLPVVADVIAESLGVTRGELRELGAEGRITAEIILDAFAEARGELEDRFGETVPTIGQSLQVLRNRFVQFIGILDQTTGASTILSRAILVLSENLETLGRVAATVGIALAIDFARRGLGAAIAGVRALTVAILANPIGAILTVITVATAALIAWSDELTLGGQRLATVGDLGVAVFEKLTDVAEDFIEFIQPALDTLGATAEQVFGDVEFSIEGVLRVAARVVDGTIGFFRGLANTIPLLFENIPASIELIFVRAFNTASEAATSFVNLLIDGINRLAELAGFDPIQRLQGFTLTASEEAANLGRRIDQAMADAIESQGAAQAALDGLLERAEQIAQDRISQAAAEAGQGGADLEGGGTERREGFLEGFNEQLDLMVSQTRDVTQNFQQLGTEMAQIFGPGGTLQQGLAQGIAQAIVFGKSFRGVLRAIGQQILVSIIGSLIQVGIQMGINALLGKALGAAAVASSAAQAGVLTAAWTPAATAASIATLGAAAGIGTAAVTAALAGSVAGGVAAGVGGAAVGAASAAAPAAVTTPGFIPAFADGGVIRGPGGPRDDGILIRASNEEFMVNAASSRRFRTELQDINAGRAPRGRGDGPRFGNVTFAPTINVTEEMDPEELAAQLRQQFNEWLEEEGQVGGRLEDRLT